MSEVDRAAALQRALLAAKSNDDFAPLWLMYLDLLMESDPVRAELYQRTKTMPLHSLGGVACKYDDVYLAHFCLNQKSPLPCAALLLGAAKWGAVNVFDHAAARYTDGDPNQRRDPLREAADLAKAYDFPEILDRVVALQARLAAERANAAAREPRSGSAAPGETAAGPPTLADVIAMYQSLSPEDQRENFSDRLTEMMRERMGGSPIAASDEDEDFGDESEDETEHDGLDDASSDVEGR